MTREDAVVQCYLILAVLGAIRQRIEEAAARCAEKEPRNDR